MQWGEERRAFKGDCASSSRASIEEGILRNPPIFRHDLMAKLLLVDMDNDEGMNFQKSFFPDIFEDLNQSFDVEDVYIDILCIYIY